MREGEKTPIAMWRRRTIGEMLVLAAMESNQINIGDAKLDDDPVVQLLLSGRADRFEEAEEIYLNESLQDAYRLLAGPLSNEQLAQHPLFRLLYFRGSRGWEDSL